MVNQEGLLDWTASRAALRSLNETAATLESAVLQQTNGRGAGVSWEQSADSRGQNVTKRVQTGFRHHAVRA